MNHMNDMKRRKNEMKKGGEWGAGAGCEIDRVLGAGFSEKDCQEAVVGEEG